MTENYNLIEAYLNGALSEKEIAIFQQRLKIEPAFLEAYEMRKSMFLLLKHKKGKADLKSRLEVLSHEYGDEEKKSERTDSAVKEVRLKPRWIRYVAAAAAVLLLVFVLRPKQDLYEKYAGNIQMDMIEKSVTFSFEEIQTAFNNGDYNPAYLGLHKYLKTTPADAQSLYFLGICALKLNKTTEALDIFKTIAALKPASAYTPKVKWNQALIYLKAEDFSNCKKVLNQIPEENDFFTPAQNLLTDIKWKWIF